MKLRFYKQLLIAVTILIFILNLSCEKGKYPFSFEIEPLFHPPQWGMFMKNPRHTGNAGTPEEYIIGPEGPDVSIQWVFETDGGFYGSPAIGEDGIIYFGTFNVNNETPFYAVNPDGTLKWKYQPEIECRGVWATPAIAKDGTVYFCGRRSGLFAMNPDGTLKWHVEADNAADGSPIICLASDGKIRWTLPWMGYHDDIFCAPAISPDGTLYFGFMDEGNLYAIK